MTQGRHHLLEILCQADLLTQLNVDLLNDYIDRWHVSALHAVLQTKMLSESDLADATARQLGLNRLFHCATLPIESEVLELVPFYTARLWECLPVRLSDNRLELVVADPTRQDRYAPFSAKIGLDLALAVAERSDIVGAIDEQYPLKAQLPELFGM